MAGFANDANLDEIVQCNNVDFTGNPQAAAQVTLNGQLLIGSTVAPHIRVSTLTAGSGITITNGNGTITLASGGSVPIQFTGNSGVAVPAAGNLNVITANTTVRFVGSGSTLTEDFGLSNLIMGSSLPSVTSGVRNVGVGLSALNAITTGFDNTVVGYQAGLTTATGNNNTAVGKGALAAAAINNNTAIGYQALAVCTNSSNTGIGLNSLLALTSGSENSCLGASSAANLVTGVSNLILGVSAGSSYNGAQSSNILLMNIGDAGDSNTIRIGQQGNAARQQNRCFVAGITGVSVSNLQFVTIDTVTGQLGSSATGASGVFFQAYLSANQTVAGGSATDTIIFDNVIVNDGAGYNGATGVFTAPTGGFYEFTVTGNFIDLAVPVGNTALILGYTGSAQSLRLFQVGAGGYVAGGVYCGTASFGLPMAPGDTIQIQPFADGVGNYMIAGGAVATSAFNTASTFSGCLTGE